MLHFFLKASLNDRESLKNQLQATTQNLAFFSMTHNFPKKSPMIKSWVSFEKFRKFSSWWALRFSNLADKIGFKDVNLINGTFLLTYCSLKLKTWKTVRSQLSLTIMQVKLIHEIQLLTCWWIFIADCSLRIKRAFFYFQFLIPFQLIFWINTFILLF